MAQFQAYQVGIKATRLVVLVISFLFVAALVNALLNREITLKEPLKLCSSHIKFYFTHPMSDRRYEEIRERTVEIFGKRYFAFQLTAGDVRLSEDRKKIDARYIGDCDKLDQTWPTVRSDLRARIPGVSGIGRNGYSFYPSIQSPSEYRDGAVRWPKVLPKAQQSPN